MSIYSIQLLLIGSIVSKLSVPSNEGLIEKAQEQGPCKLLPSLFLCALAMLEFGLLSHSMLNEILYHLQSGFSRFAKG